MPLPARYTEDRVIATPPASLAACPRCLHHTARSDRDHACADHLCNHIFPFAYLLFHPSTTTRNFFLKQIVKEKKNRDRKRKRESDDFSLHNMIHFDGEKSCDYRFMKYILTKGRASCCHARVWECGQHHSCGRTDANTVHTSCGRTSTAWDQRIPQPILRHTSGTTYRPAKLPGTTFRQSPRQLAGTQRPVRMTQCLRELLCGNPCRKTGYTVEW